MNYSSCFPLLFSELTALALVFSKIISQNTIFLYFFCVCTCVWVSMCLWNRRSTSTSRVISQESPTIYLFVCLRQGLLLVCSLLARVFQSLLGVTGMPFNVGSVVPAEVHCTYMANTSLTEISVQFPLYHFFFGIIASKVYSCSCLHYRKVLEPDKIPSISSQPPSSLTHWPQSPETQRWPCH